MAVAPVRFTNPHQGWARGAKHAERVVGALGILMVTSSIVVAVFNQELGTLGTRIVGAISAISTGYLSFFQPQKKVADLWSGWKYFNSALALYEGDKIDLEKLASEYKRAEELVGTMEVNKKAP